MAAQGRVHLKAGGSISNESVADQFLTKNVEKRSWIRSKRIKEHGVAMSQASILSTQDSIVLKAEGNLNNTGGSMTAAKNIQGDINLNALVKEVNNEYKKRGFSGLSYGSNKNQSNAFYQLDSQLLGDNVLLTSNEGHINTEGALIAGNRSRQYIRI